MPRPMIVALQLAPPMRAWHRRLVERLEASAHTVAVEFVAGEAASPGVGLVLRVERTLYRRAPELFAPVADDQPVPASAIPQIRIVLGGRPPRGTSWIEPLFDKRRGDAALFHALFAGRAPVIEVVSNAGQVLAAGLPATEDPLVLSRALDAVLSRLVTLVAQAVAGNAPPIAMSEALPTERMSAPAFLLRGLASKLRRKFGAARGRPDHWRIDYGDTAAPPPTLPHDLKSLVDDGTEFHADPFPFEDGRGRYIFFETFPYATGKGTIGFVSIGADGTASTPKTALEHEVHLSYPVLLRDGSDIYMMPEMSASGRVQLFRADPFPDRWVPDHILIDGIAASDATLVQHDGRYWLFATLAQPGESTWDQLGLFHAPSLFGPWTAHPRNPVLIDAGAARPAGAMWHENGQLMRVAQDCRGGYGVGLAVCRVDRLDETEFAQTVVRRIEPTVGQGAVGMHTLNRSETLTVIDLRLPHEAVAGKRSAGKP